MAVTCTQCGESKPRSEFYKDSRKRNGLNSWCKECVRAAQRQRYADNPDYMREYNAKNRARVIEHFGVECARCESTERLELDHVNGDGAEHRARIGYPMGGNPLYQKLISSGFDTMGYELQVLCFDCHRAKSLSELERDAATGRFLAGVS